MNPQDSLRWHLQEITRCDEMLKSIQQEQRRPEESCDLSWLSRTIKNEIAQMKALSESMAFPYQAIKDAMMIDVQQARRQLAELNGSLVLDTIKKELANMRTLGESIAAPCRAIQDVIRSEWAVYDEMAVKISKLESLDFSIPEFAQAKSAWDMASMKLARRMSDIGLAAQRQMLSARLFDIPTVYTAFLKHTTECLASNPAPDVAVRLRGSLNLAKQQMLSISDAVCDFIAIPDDEDEPNKIRTLNAPFAQQRELLASHTAEDENDTEAMTQVSLIAQTVRRAHRVLELVTQCNEAAKTSGSCGEIFKPTTRLMLVFADLPWLAATDRSRFQDIVDCLYILFYESAGKDNLRFLEKHGGPLADADCDIVWCIKHLRNKWSRHDVDHGRERDIQRSWEELAAKFQWLGLTEYPTDARHFQQLHEELLVLAEKFLMSILSRFRLP
jgi:hypothetical protein